MLSYILILLSALFFPGLISWTKAKLSGRKGASIFQPVKDMLRLFKKGNVYADGSSYIFQIGAIVTLASILLAMCFIPFGDSGSLISFEGDVVFFAYVLGLGRFLLIVAALDIGSGFEGMGANREALYAMLVEPVFFIILGAIALLTGYSSFETIFTQLHISGYIGDLFGALVVYLLVQVAMVENSRLPVDDPKTHLELTMVHEVMVLDHSGFDLGIIQLANALKFTMYGALISNFLLPASWPLAPRLALFFLIQALFAISIGFLESFKARNKLSKNPRFLATLNAIAIIAFFTVLIITQTIGN